MEKIEVDNKDHPIEDIIIEKAHIFIDPYQEADEMLAKERADDIEKQQKAIADEKKAKERSKPLTVFRSGVGKYLNTEMSKPSTSTDESLTKRKKTDKSFGFGNFNAW